MKLHDPTRTLVADLQPIPAIAPIDVRVVLSVIVHVFPQGHAKTRTPDSLFLSSVLPRDHLPAQRVHPLESRERTGTTHPSRPPPSHLAKTLGGGGSAGAVGGWNDEARTRKVAPP
jgi:hypothetical protein